MKILDFCSLQGAKMKFCALQYTKNKKFEISIFFFCKKVFIIMLEKRNKIFLWFFSILLSKKILNIYLKYCNKKYNITSIFLISPTICALVRKFAPSLRSGAKHSHSRTKIYCSRSEQIGSLASLGVQTFAHFVSKKWNCKNACNKILFWII